MRIGINDSKELLGLYMNLNESSVANMGVGTPNSVTVPAPGDSASGGPGKPKAPNKNFLATTGVGPGSESNEEEADDEQTQMARTQLLMIADRSLELFQMLKSGSKLEPWTASKLTLAADYVETVADYMKYGEKKSDCMTQVSIVPVEAETENMVGEGTKQRIDPKCWKGYRKSGTKMKGGVRVNNCVKVKKKR